MQSYISGFAVNIDNLGPYGQIMGVNEMEDDPPGIRKASRSQCKNQRIQTSGEVQSFSFLGLVVVVIMTLFLILMALTLERCVLILRQRSESDGVIARQTDDKLHLLRMALESQKAEKTELEWLNGSLTVPVTNSVLSCERPRFGSNGLGSYANQQIKR